MVFGSLGIGIISILLIIIIAGTLKNDGSEGLYNSKNLKIMHYDCELEEDLKDRLSVIFVEEEKSDHMFSIMNTPDYYPLRDTIVFSVYDKEKKQVTVNKTNCGTGYKAYNDVIKVLNQIFFFKIEQTNKQELKRGN